jgi:hypothetical protein
VGAALARMLDTRSAGHCARQSRDVIPAHGARASSLCSAKTSGEGCACIRHSGKKLAEEEMQALSACSKPSTSSPFLRATPFQSALIQAESIRPERVVKSTASTLLTSLFAGQ